MSLSNDFSSLPQEIGSIYKCLDNISVPKVVVTQKIETLIKHLGDIQTPDEAIKTQLSELATRLKVQGKGYGELADKITQAIAPSIQVSDSYIPHYIPPPSGLQTLSNQAQPILDNIIQYLDPKTLADTSLVSKQSLQASDQAKIDWMNSGKPIRQLGLK